MAILKIPKGKGIITDKWILQKWAVWVWTASNWLRGWSSVRNIVIGSVQWLSAECWAFTIDSQRCFGCVTSVINLLHQRQFSVRHHQYNIDCKQTTRALFVDSTDFVMQGEWVNMNQWIQKQSFRVALKKRSVGAHTRYESVKASRCWNYEQIFLKLKIT